MYAALWRHLPGPVVVRLLIILVLVVLVVAVCFQWVFPVVAPLLPFDHNTVGGDSIGQSRRIGQVGQIGHTVLHSLSAPAVRP